MENVGQAKILIRAACDALEREVIRPAQVAARQGHAERNVLLVGLGRTDRMEVVDALHRLGIAYQEIEEAVAGITMAVANLRGYADRL